MKLDEFTKAYIECALWSSMDESDEQGGEPLDKNYDISDIAEETLAEMAEDCRAFQEDNASDLALYDHAQYTADELGGHDFWLTRNHHGAGFWDRTSVLPNAAAVRLNKAAHAYGEIYLYVDDDGKIYGA